uniref:Uncharacterized protein n=1 Tax=Chaetoceros debilis TaxID=122233 RepID=A0A7S3Q0D0_9STRA
MVAPPSSPRLRVGDRMKSAKFQSFMDRKQRIDQSSSSLPLSPSGVKAIETFAKKSNSEDRATPTSSEYLYPYKAKKTMTVDERRSYFASQKKPLSTSTIQSARRAVSRAHNRPKQTSAERFRSYSNPRTNRMEQRDIHNESRGDGQVEGEGRTGVEKGHLERERPKQRLEVATLPRRSRSRSDILRSFQKRAPSFHHKPKSELEHSRPASAKLTLSMDEERTGTSADGESSKGSSVMRARGLIAKIQHKKASALDEKESSSSAQKRISSIKVARPSRQELCKNRENSSSGTRISTSTTPHRFKDCNSALYDVLKKDNIDSATIDMIVAVEKSFRQGIGTNLNAADEKSKGSQLSSSLSKAHSSEKVTPEASTSEQILPSSLPPRSNSDNNDADAGTSSLGDVKKKAREIIARRNSMSKLGKQKSGSFHNDKSTPSPPPTGAIGIDHNSADKSVQFKQFNYHKNPIGHGVQTNDSLPYKHFNHQPVPMFHDNSGAFRMNASVGSSFGYNGQTTSLIQQQQPMGMVMHPSPMSNLSMPSTFDPRFTNTGSTIQSYSASLQDDRKRTVSNSYVSYSSHSTSSSSSASSGSSSSRSGSMSYCSSRESTYAR